MSRPIKFRAWNKLAHKMAVIDALDFAFDAYRAHVGKFSGSGHLADIDLMQFTGLVDRHGQEIYESDIVIWDGGQYTVIFSEHEGAWILKDDRDDWECPTLYGVSSPKQSRIHILSNVYEYHKLVEQEVGL